MSGPDGGSGDTPGARALPDWFDLLRRRLRLADGLGRARSAGVAIATSPKTEAFRDGLMSLHRYTPHGPVLSGPLLIVHGLFGRQTVADLEPGRSLVHALLAAGCDTWVIDWGSPTRSHRHLDLADYADYWLGDALAAMRAETSRRPALLGICQGGLFALCHAALHPEAVAGLALAVTPVDFHADAADPDPRHGLLNLWVRSLGEATIEALLAERGNLPGALTGALFEQLLPARHAAKYGTDLLGLADDPEGLATFLRMEAWLGDRPDHPGAAARQWLIDLYTRNALIHGHFHLDGHRVDLGAIRCPVLNIVAERDHIVPPPCSLALAGRTASPDYRVLSVPTGHVGVFVSEKAQALVAPTLAAWVAALESGCRAAGEAPEPPSEEASGRSQG